VGVGVGCVGLGRIESACDAGCVRRCREAGSDARQAARQQGGRPGVSSSGDAGSVSQQTGAGVRGARQQESAGSGWASKQRKGVAPASLQALAQAATKPLGSGKRIARASVRRQSMPSFYRSSLVGFIGKAAPARWAGGSLLLMRDPRHAKLADILVRFSTRVQPGDVVAITADPVALPLVKATYERVLEAGGHPYWTVTSETLRDSLLARGTDEQLSFLNPIAKHEVETVDVFIRFIAETNTRSASRIPAERQRLLSAARKPILMTFMERIAKKELRWVLTQAPTYAAAQDAEMSLDEYEDFVYRAGMLDREDPVAAWEHVKATQERAREWLQRKKSLRFRVAGADGSMDVSTGATDLEVPVEGGTWINCFGDNNFPDGEVFTGPQGGEGVVNFNYPAVHNGREVEGVRLEFKGGKVVEASAKKGEDFLIQMLDQDEGARTMGEIAIGTNYSIEEPSRNTLFDEKIGGTFHLAVGAGYPEAGNSNESALHWDMVCNLRQGGMIEADGEVFSKDGRFVFERWPGR